MEKSDLTNEQIRLLLIEDNPGDTRLFREYLKADFAVKYVVHTAETLVAGMNILKEQTVDIVITDLGLPDSKGLETPSTILREFPHIPVIITTGLDDEKLGVESIKVGVQNYLVKNKITPSLLVLSIKFSIEQKRIIEELKKSKDEIWQQRELIETYYDSAPVGLAVVDKDLRYLHINQRLAEMNGFSMEAHIGRKLQDIVPQIATRAEEFVRQILATGDPIRNIELQREIPALHKSNLIYISNWYPLKNPEGEIIGINISVEDVTERKQSELALKKSQEENLAIVNAIPDFLFGLTSDGVFRKYFSAKLNFWITSPDQYLNRNISDFLPSHLSAEIMAAIDKAIRINEMVTFENELLLNEETRHFEFRILPLDHNEVLALVRDISKRKQTEGALVQSELMFRKLLSTSPEAIIRMDMKSRITAFSDVAPGILGYEKAFNLTGLPFLQFISDNDKKKMREFLKKIQMEGMLQNLELELVKNDKSSFLGEISLALIEESDGNPNGYIAIVRDITSRKIMEMQMIHNARMLSLGEMAAGIAHEINQPLNIISITLENLMVEMLEDHVPDKSYIKTKSEKIFDNITRMRNIIDHIRSFSREHDDLIHGIFDLHDGITNAISMIAEQFRHRVIELILDFDNTIKPYPGDIYKFEQVILNLLTNAKDAIEEKHKGSKTSGKKFVRILTHQDEKFIYIEVEDNGIGIKTAELEKVLIPFYTTKETGKGTGLGLSISYGIIKEMQGTVVISSKRMSGTTVLITFPQNPEKPARQS